MQTPYARVCVCVCKLTVTVFASDIEKMGCVCVCAQLCNVSIFPSDMCLPVWTFGWYWFMFEYEKERRSLQTYRMSLQVNYC